MKKLNAFTLVEMLVVSSILSLVLLGVYLSFHTGALGYRTIEENIDVYQRATRVLDRLNQDLHNSFSFALDDRKFSGTDKAITFLSLESAESGGKPAKDFVCLSYAFGADEVSRLSRRQNDSLNQYSTAAPQILSDRIGDLSFSYEYMDSVTHALSWRPDWTDPATAPLAVKVTLTVMNKEGHNFERIINLPLTEKP